MTDWSSRNWGEDTKVLKLSGSSESPLIFPGRDGAPFSNQAFNARNQARLRARSGAAHPLRHTAATLLLNERGANLRDVQKLLCSAPTLES